MKAIRFLMCVNKSADKEKVIIVPKEKAGPLKKFYTICKKLTKDTNERMGNWINLGAQNTPGRSLGINGESSLPRWHAQADAPEVKAESLTFSAKSERI